MKFWAKVGFEDKKSATDLVRAFFKDFNPESSIVIRGMEAKLEIVFQRQPPQELIHAICSCEMEELNYGRNLTEYEAEEGVFEEEQTESDVNDTPEKEEAKSDIDDAPKTEEKEPKRELRKVNGEIVDIPQLKEIAEKAESFEHFVELIAEWLEMHDLTNFFKKIVIASTETEGISWKNIKETLATKGIIYQEWAKIRCSKQVSTKLDSVTIMKLLRAISCYVGYPFKQENLKSSTEQEPVETSDNVTKMRIKMNCMPEISSFEEALGNIDKAKPIEERVQKVLVAMGLNELPNKDRTEILAIANKAVNSLVIAIESILSESGIPESEIRVAQMCFTKFVNNFVKEHGGNQLIRLSTFLTDLRQVVLTEDELKSKKKPN